MTTSRNVDIYEEITRLRNRGQRAALATIIQIRGVGAEF